MSHNLLSILQPTYIIMKSAILATIIGSAAAFAPAPVAKTTTALNAFETEIGAQAPLGLFDPLGMLDGADQERFDRLRYVEIKHGRIAMIAFLGQIVTRNGQHFDGIIDKAGDTYASFPNGLAAIFGDDAIPAKGVLQILIAIGIMEVTIMSDWTESAGKRYMPCYVGMMTDILILTQFIYIIISY